jgi:plasmid stabilization system protein ParE
MIYFLKYSPRALETFEEIARQVSNRWGDKYADEFRKRTVKVIEGIRISPFIFQAIDSDINIRKGFIHRNCSIFYEVKDTSIEILFFWDNRQDPIL